MESNAAVDFSIPCQCCFISSKAEYKIQSQNSCQNADFKAIKSLSVKTGDWIKSGHRLWNAVSTKNPKHIKMCLNCAYICLPLLHIYNVKSNGGKCKINLRRKAANYWGWNLHSDKEHPLAFQVSGRYPKTSHRQSWDKDHAKASTQY